MQVMILQAPSNTFGATNAVDIADLAQKVQLLC